MEEKYFKRDLEINVENVSFEEDKMENINNCSFIQEIGNTMTEYFIG